MMTTRVVEYQAEHGLPGFSPNLGIGADLKRSIGLVSFRAMSNGPHACLASKQNAARSHVEHMRQTGALLAMGHTWRGHGGLGKLALLDLSPISPQKSARSGHLDADNRSGFFRQADRREYISLFLESALKAKCSVTVYGHGKEYFGQPQTYRSGSMPASWAALTS